jgi:ABC-type Na+ efflux pump permease subunit
MGAVIRHDLILLVKNPKVLFSHLFGLGLILLMLLAAIGEGSGRELTGVFLILIFAAAAGTPLSLTIYAFVGEKERRTLEPLLLVPLRTVTLVVAKLVVPCLLALVELAIIWGVVLVSVWELGTSAQIDAVLNGITIYAGTVMAPLFTLLFSIVATIISGRSPDAQTATSLNLIVATPIMILLLAVWLGWIGIDRRALAFGTVLVIALLAVALRVAVSMLHPEALLRRRS